MRIGFCGAHRTGKSTLARLIADERGLPLLPNPNTAVAHGYDMKNGNRLDDQAGFELQLAILKGFDERLTGASFVSDRTPLDAAAYLLADATANAGDGLIQEMALQYIDQAIKLTDDRFDVVILVPPAIAVEQVDGKPPVNAAYQEHLHYLIRGFMSELNTPHGEIERDNLDLEDRVNAVERYIYGVERRRALRRAMVASNEGKFDLDKALA